MSILVRMLSENANKPRYQDGGRGHYEVWYTTGNVPGTGIGWWIRTTLEQPLEGEAYAEQWFSVFEAKSGKRWGLCKRFALNQLVNEPPFALSLGNQIHLGMGHYKGVIEGQGKKAHKGIWDFSWIPEKKAHLHLPDFAYTSEFASTKALAPTLDGRANGFIELDGVRHEFKHAPMYQTHLWGKKHAERWAWAHCNAFDGAEGVSFEGLSVVINKYGMTLPPLTLVRLRTPGMDISIRELWEAPFPKSSFKSGYWSFEGVQGGHRLKGEIKAPEGMLLRADYDDPDGDHSVCNNCCVSSGWISVEKRRGIFNWEQVARYEAAGTFHMETAARDEDPSVDTAIVKF